MEHTEREVVAKWHAVMSRRQIVDFATTSRRHGKKANKRKVVWDTWKAKNDGGEGEGNVTYDGKGRTGVLVGRLMPEYVDAHGG